MADLTGKRVLELGGYVASPYATSILLHLGAEVIKVESPEGDPTRKMVRGGPGGSFIAFARGKKSVCLDLRSSQGYGAFSRLLASADIIVHNLSPKSTRSLKVEYDTCKEVNENIVYCHIRGYGPGPLYEEIASNPIIEASTGVMNGNRINGRPSRLGPSYHDMFAGCYAVLGILSTLNSGNSKKSIEVGLYETGLHIASRDFAGVQLNAAVGSKNQSEFAKPGYGAYETADNRWIYLLMLSDNHWRVFCEAMSLPELHDDSLTTMHHRQQRRSYVEELVKRVVRHYRFDELAEKLRSAGFGFTEVKSFEEVLHEPQASQPEKLSTFTFMQQDYALPSFPVWSDSVERTIKGCPPELGQHTKEVLLGVGYTPEQYAELCARRAAIGT